MENFDIEKYTLRLDLLNETVEQIKKDFSENGLTVSFTGNTQTAYTELFKQIHPFIKKLLISGYPQLMSILYRIDIPEKLFKTAINLPMDDASEQLTHLIIKRELQKVVIRNFYKKNEE